MSRPWTLVLLVLAGLSALGIRALSYPETFPLDGSVQLMTEDSAYHARRALYSFVNFPAVLRFDPYMAWPDGATVPMPPLYDWALGGVARAFGDSEAIFERVAAWWSPVLSALTVLPVYWIGRAVGGNGIGLAAAFLFAVLPAGARRSMLGDVDHHAAVALLGASWIAISVELVRAAIGLRLALLSVALVGVRAALVLSWSGSFLYLVVGESALLLVNAVAGRREIAWAHAAGAGGAAILVGIWLVAAGPSAGVFSSTDVSWLHVFAFVGVALVAASIPWLRDTSATARMSRLLLAASAGVVVAVVVLVLLPSMQEALGTAAAFLSKTDSWGARNPEQRSIFADSVQKGIFPIALRNYGWLAYTLPIAVFFAFERIRKPSTRLAAICIACWSLALGTLAVMQVRFGIDFAPVAAVCFALLAGVAVRGLSKLVSRPVSVVVVVMAFGVLLWPGISTSYVRLTKLAIQRARLAHEDRIESPPAALSPTRSMTEFGRLIREATPETLGFFDSSLRPEYAILCKPSHGHALHYFARRATPANNFGPYLDLEKYLASVAFFYQTTSELAALRIAESLRVRYVMTFARETDGVPSFADLLHAGDGARPGASSERFRLITEGPPGGVPFYAQFPSRGVARRVIPYKLFELVPGAVLTARAAPGTEMRVRLPLVTPLGRRFRYLASARADDAGRIELRVPYPTDPSAPVRSQGPYRIQLGAVRLRLEVSEAETRDGSTVRVPDGSSEPW